MLVLPTLKSLQTATRHAKPSADLSSYLNHGHSEFNQRVLVDFLRLSAQSTGEDDSMPYSACKNA